jgi:hypothetical protein
MHVFRKGDDSQRQTSRKSLKPIKLMGFWTQPSKLVSNAGNKLRTGFPLQRIVHVNGKLCYLQIPAYIPSILFHTSN